MASIFASLVIGVVSGVIAYYIYQKRAVKAPSFSYGDETAQIILVIF